jgi:hypothetical protein
MSLFDSASIVITPNGQKAGKLYSIKPTDGSGDLSVTRATSATRVDANGLIEIPRTNLLTYSEQFDNAAWVKTNTTVTANATTAPDGTTTADKLIPNTTSALHIAESSSFSSVSGSNYIFSFYAKKAEYDFIQVTGSSALLPIRANFDLLNGTLGTVDSGITATITSVGNGWYRCTALFAAAATGSYRVILCNITNSAAGRFPSFAGNGTDGVFVWGAQLEQRVSATEYIPTVASIRTKFAGITQDGGSASNIPRLDYTNGTCPSILVEPQRTNLLSYSEQFDNAYWSKTNMVIVANDTTAPDGTNTADRATASLYPSTSITKSNLLTAANHTLSVYVKAGSVSTFRLDLVTAGFALGSNCIFNLSTLATTITNYGVTTGTTANITNVGNGWYRCSLTVLTTAVVYFAQLYPAANGSVFIWGAQLEAGAYATSYIPTTSASVTRNADFLTRAGFGNTSTSGTLLFDLYAENISSSAGEYILQLFAGAIITDAFFSTANSISIIANGTSIQIFNNGFTQLVQSITPTQGQRVKIAIRYNGTNISSSINGTVSSVLTDASVGVKNAIRINNGQFSTHAFNSVVFIPEYLTNEQLIQLTTI